MRILRITKLLLILTILNFCLKASAESKTFSNENLKYIISYKWGLIHQDAAEATLSLKRNGNIYDIMLAAKTKPWADRIYQIRDTLKGKMRVNDLKPIMYEKLTHEKKVNERDAIRYSEKEGVTTGNVVLHRYDKKGNLTVKEKTLTASGPVYDMLSIFYYLRMLDFDQLDRKKIYKATIFSGSQKETIHISSLGKEKIKLKDKTEREAYHIRFNFTRGGGKKSSEDIDTWISTDNKHIPLYLVGKLPIGEVRAYYV